MLTRRSLLGSSAVVAAGCSTVGNSLATPSAPQGTELNVVASNTYMYLSPPIDGGPYIESSEEKYRRAAVALEEDTGNPYGSARGGYSLALRFFNEIFPFIEGNPKSLGEYKAAKTRALRAVAGILRNLKADLVTVRPEEARRWGRNGLLLPLDHFSGAEAAELERAFYPSMLNPYREDGALYALPVGAMPLMLFYDEEFIAEQGVSPPDLSWDWDDLAENAVKLTTRKADGTVARWGLVAHGVRIFWALWQNEASLVDMEMLKCRLQEPAAVEALQFVHDLMHKHQVSPVATPWDLWHDTRQAPPVLLYDQPPLHVNQSHRFRMAALPRGKVHTAQVSTAFGIGIAARTQHAEAAFAALRGFARAMQTQVIVPASKVAVARLAETRKDLRPAEVAAVQHAMEHGREWPRLGLPYLVIESVMDNLGHGDDVAIAVSKACHIVNHLRQTGRLPLPKE